MPPGGYASAATANDANAGVLPTNSAFEVPTGIDIEVLSKAVADYRVNIAGAVRQPGVYLAIPGTPIADLVTVAGGLVDDADLTSFEVTSTTIDNASGTSTTARQSYPVSPEMLARVQLKAYDRLSFHRVYSDRAGGTISIDGEVRFPGSFDIMRSEKLSSVLRRAGGYTEVAYPQGAILLRASVAKAEEEENQRTASDLRSQLLTFVTRPPTQGGPAPTAETIAAIQTLIAQQANAPALGRVPVVARLEEIEKDPDLDTVLEPGDRIVIPRYPSTVLVMGEVLRPGAQRFVRSSSVGGYVEMAGGSTEQADTSRIIIVLPDGSVRSNDDSWLNFSSNSVPPGSTVYVPRRLEMTSFRQILTDTIQIVSQLATTAAALAVLSKQ